MHNSYLKNLNIEETWVIDISKFWYPGVAEWISGYIYNEMNKTVSQKRE